MVSTFFGLEAARSGLYAAQSALYTIGHNVANAETPGYSRQRVNLVQKQAYPTPGRFRADIPGQFGTGVDTQTVQRIRDRYLDVQYRGENSKLGYWSSRFNALSRMEDVMNELNETGLNETMDSFWQSLQDLAVNPSNLGARSVVLERGRAVTETFNYLAESLKHNQKDLRNELDVATTKINSLLEQINQINKQIGEVEPNGYLPNDLYDERDRLLDELSSYIDIKVTPVESGGNALKVAEGKVTVELAGFEPPITLVDGNRYKVRQFSLNESKTNGLIESISVGGRTIGADDFVENLNINGSLKGLIEAHGYTNIGSTIERGIYPSMMSDLDQMAYDFANAFNTVHRNGWSLEDINNGVQTQRDFFDLGGLSSPKGAAAAIKVSDDMNRDRIAASATGEIGDGQNALKLAEVKNTSFQSYFEAVIGEMAVMTQEAERMKENSETLVSSVEQRRKSVSSVSLDEEMTNMIQFQHMYNAAARMITLQDEILDRIINGMGLVGR
ncbi:flagellar hook-associated protein FlgK [Aeribacillus sp. FSL M8-0235]|uniref:flagellar hook-associated protein FlgK n=1 Tax=Aeribacillus sp. FSL M8-0235 TaxID=2954576 RepID=UPI0030FC9B6F